MRVRATSFLVALVITAVAAVTLQAQGKGNDHKSKGPPPGHAKKVATVDDGISSARVVLVEKGYTVARVERLGTTRVIYYYRGNRGRGRGHGPLEKIVIRPTPERLIFEGGAPSLLAQIRVRVGG
jgi:hypothetical protein